MSSDDLYNSIFVNGEWVCYHSAFRVTVALTKSHIDSLQLTTEQLVNGLSQTSGDQNSTSSTSSDLYATAESSSSLTTSPQMATEVPSSLSQPHLVAPLPYTFFPFLKLPDADEALEQDLSSPHTPKHPRATLASTSIPPSPTISSRSSVHFASGTVSRGGERPPARLRASSVGLLSIKHNVHRRKSSLPCPLNA